MKLNEVAIPQNLETVVNNFAKKAEADGMYRLASRHLQRLPPPNLDKPEVMGMDEGDAIHYMLAAFGMKDLSSDNKRQLFKVLVNMMHEGNVVVQGDDKDRLGHLLVDMKELEKAILNILKV